MNDKLKSGLGLVAVIVLVGGFYVFNNNFSANPEEVFGFIKRFKVKEHDCIDLQIYERREGGNKVVSLFLGSNNQKDPEIMAGECVLAISKKTKRGEIFFLKTPDAYIAILSTLFMFEIIDNHQELGDYLTTHLKEYKDSMSIDEYKDGQNTMNAALLKWADEDYEGLSYCKKLYFDAISDHLLLSSGSDSLELCGNKAFIYGMEQMVGFKRNYY